MATYSRTEMHTTRVEFHIPAGAPRGAAWAEVMTAINAAIAELRAAGELRPDEEVAADTISVAPHNEDVVVVSYELRRRVAS